jgi:hypothetical protein
LKLHGSSPERGRRGGTMGGGVACSRLFCYVLLFREEERERKEKEEREEKVKEGKEEKNMENFSNLKISEK